MKRKVKLKKLPIVIFILFLVPLLTLVYFNLDNISKEEIMTSPPVMEHIQETVPVVSENNFIKLPYNSSSVTIGRNYYDYKANDENQQNAITYYENTYYQNTGVDYISESMFDVVSILEGTVVQVKEDDKVGKEVEIEHKNGLISIYQSLSEVTVKKGDLVIRGQLLGKSGTNEMEKDLGNHLHFELYENGNQVNPNNYLNKEYKKEN